ncbi:phosphoethanolamine transferase [Methylocystis echinoides]|uniref:Phosphoethanolamine transferase CptA n=1 Tax=Methylocystis echinoides TaxID=29468 RepID=A0A9W6LRZ8_9HYPH|nr:phosphoethanolamine transferase [Methylocystis echinoides]GLI92931.1 phosphoethanolamine transferase CptA [Methylocystis echinoides]
MKAAYLPVGVLAATSAYLTLAPTFILMDSDTAYLLRMVAVCAFNTVLTALIATSILSLGNVFARRISYGALSLYFLLYAAATFYFVYVYHQMIGVPMATAIVDSTPVEAGEYFAALFKPAPIGFAAALSAPVLVALAWGGKPIPLLRPQLRLIVVAAAISLVAAGSTREFLRRNSLYFAVATSVAEVMSTKREVIETIQRFKTLKAVGVRSADPEPRVHVLVLGESASRSHMSLYGYDRETNPLLSGIKDRLHIASDVCSSRGATAPALQELMSFAQHDDKKPLFSQPNILETLKAAGYRTYWLSNQQTSGSLATWASIFSHAANTAVFVNSMGGTDDVSHMDSRSYDEKLFAPFEAALADPDERKFILVHLMGSHAAYELRYPPSYARFSPSAPAPEEKSSLLDFWRKKAADRDTYDNSMLYNDYVLRTLIAKAEAHGVDTLTYVSDHGESLGENGALVGHADGPGPRQVYEIPLFFHLGDKFAAQRPETAERVKAALDRPFQTDRLSHSLLDLYAIEAPQRHPEWSLFAPDFRPAARYCDQLKRPDKVGAAIP